jgi:hypothetical protein
VGLENGTNIQLVYKLVFHGHKFRKCNYKGMETLHKVVQTSVYLIKHSDILLAAYMSTVKYEVNIGME